MEGLSSYVFNCGIVFVVMDLRKDCPYLINESEYVSFQDDY